MVAAKSKTSYQQMAKRQRPKIIGKNNQQSSAPNKNSSCVTLKPKNIVNEKS